MSQNVRLFVESKKTMYVLGVIQRLFSTTVVGQDVKITDFNEVEIHCRVVLNSYTRMININDGCDCDLENHTEIDATSGMWLSIGSHTDGASHMKRITNELVELGFKVWYNDESYNEEFSLVEEPFKDY